MDERRVFLITGGSSGLGAAVARRAADAGWALVLAGRDTARLEAVAGGLPAEVPVLVRACDVREWDQVSALAGAAVGRFGRIDAVFANAGFGIGRGFTASTPEEWRSMVLTNVYGAAITVRATYAEIARRGGHVLLTGSVAGRKALPGSLYSATKWAVAAMAESLRQELHGTGARVTLVEPGVVDTPFYDAGAPIEPPLTADDVARAVMFALQQPPHVDVNEILMRPTAQGE
jgi:NADP-dependent 3-hydroxy acid dehydrogenase YdfG